MRSLACALIFVGILFAQKPISNPASSGIGPTPVTGSLSAGAVVIGQSGTSAAWEPISGSCTLAASGVIACSASATSPINPQAATYQVLAADFAASKTIVVSSGTFTITLVASGSQPANGQYIQIINYGSGVVTIGRSGQNINGGTASLTLAAASATAPTSTTVTSDGTNYFASLGGASSGGGGTIPSTTSTLKGDGAGNAAAVTGTGTNCVLVNGSSASCGTGSPGGSNGQIQYNSSGAFGGIPWAVTNSGNTVTATSSTATSGGTSQLFGVNGTWAVTAGATPSGDAKMVGGTMAVTGTAQSGSTWSWQYATCTDTLTGGTSVLDHPLCIVDRQAVSNVAGSVITLSSPLYLTNDATNVAGTVNYMHGLTVTTGNTMNGAGTVTELDGVSVAGPTAVTGGLTLTYHTGLNLADIAGLGAGTNRQTIAIGGAIAHNAGLGITVSGAGASGSNFGIFNGTYHNYFGGGNFGDGNVTSLWNSGGYTASQRYLEVGTNAQPALATFYNGVGGWDMGLTTTGSQFGVRDSGGTEQLTILSGGKVGIANTSPAYALDVVGTINASAGLMLGAVNVIGSGGASQTIACPSNGVATITLTANLSISFTQPSGTTCVTRLEITQASSGGPYTVSFSGTKWPGGVAPVMTAAASAVDIYSILLDGTYVYATAGQNFK